MPTSSQSAQRRATFGSRVFVSLRLLFLGGCIVAVVAGCAPGTAQGPPPMPPPPPPEVIFDLPVRKSIADYEETTGRIEAVKTVEIRARVTGYLTKVNFREGAEVKAGDVLFEIDARPYEAEFLKTEAQVNQSESRLNRTNSDFARAEALRTRNAIGREEYDKLASERNEAASSVKVAKAARDIAKLHLDFTRVVAPFDGLISRQFLDEGNLVKADETPLTVMVSHDPMYAYFDVDERTLLRLRRLIDRGQLPSSPADTRMPVAVGLADEEGYPHEGVINFVDNRLDPATGTLRMRALVANPRRLLTPGLFVRIRVPIGEPQALLLVPEEALGTDQGRKYLYVLDDENKAHYRPVTVGKLYDGQRVILTGLKDGERVVVDGLQRVRPGAPVTPKPATPPPGPAEAK